MPKSVLALSDLSQYLTNDEDELINLKLIVISAELCYLRASIATQHDNFKPVQVITTALSIADKLEKWHDDLPTSLLPTAVTIPHPTPEVLSPHYHTYRDIWTATLLNHHHTALILVHEIILHHLSLIQSHYIQDPISAPPAYAYQAAHSKAALLKLIDNICASVPFFLSSPYSPINSKPSNQPRSSSGNALLWPLYVSAQISFCPNSTRIYILSRLHFIGTTLGVRQATTLAKILLRRKEVTDLMVTCWDGAGGNVDDGLEEELEVEERMEMKGGESAVRSTETSWDPWQGRWNDLVSV